MRRSWPLLALLAALGCAHNRAPPPPAIEAANRLPLEVCRVDDIEEPLLCGTYSAPADRQDPDGPRIDISVLVVPAANGNPDGLAWTEHQGGPGRPHLPLAAFFARTEAGRAFRATRDVVLVEQRGVGKSGGLYCEALGSLPVMEPYYTVDKVRACRTEMETGDVNLGHYSTLAAVDDLEHIRRWLGYSQFDVGGWSYGSRFMLTYAQRYPDSIRTMTLALPAVFDYRRPLDWARFGEDALESLFADCADDSRCNLVFPDLREDFTKLVAYLARHPETVEFINPVTGRPDRAEINRDRFVEEVHVGLLKVRSTRLLPLVIHEAARGNFEPFLFLAVPESAPAPIAEPQYLSVVCPEETAFFTLEEAASASAGTFTGMHYADEFKAACREWGLPPHPDYPLAWEKRDIPTLVVSGGRDPITPVEYGERIARSLDKVRHLAIDPMPHDFSGLNNAGCLEDILLQFLETESPDTLDTECIASMHPPPFYLEIPGS